jgi:Reverse transcriptase (RNA-dependent DNA polymerase)/Reverse transcriptase-like
MPTPGASAGGLLKGETVGPSTILTSVIREIKYKNIKIGGAGAGRPDICAPSLVSMLSAESRGALSAVDAGNAFGVLAQDHLLEGRFKSIVGSILSNRVTAMKLKGTCRDMVIASLHSQGAEVPLSLLKPHALNPRAMASKIICTAGNRRIHDCPLKPEVMREDHLRMHSDCDQSCYFWHLYKVAANGYSVPNKHYRHRQQPNHPPFISFGSHSQLALDKQLLGSDAIAEGDSVPQFAKGSQTKTVMTNALLSVVKNSARLEALLKTGIDVVDEASMTAVNDSGSMEKPLTCRVCLDLSGSGLNASLPDFPFSYASSADAVAMMTPGCWMAKLDIKSEFLTMGLAYDSRHLFGFRRGDKKWYYKRCPFGGKLFPALASAFMAEVLAVARSLGCERALVYMDDFLVMGDSREECQRNLDLLISILTRQGWTVADEKTSLPAQRIEFLGIVFDSLSMTMSADPSKADAVLYKLEAARSSVDALLSGRARAFDVEIIQSLAGNLVWFSGVITCGRLYTRPLFDLLKARRSLVVSAPLVGRLAEALDWWTMTLVAWKGSQLAQGNVRILPPSSADSYVYYQGDAGDDGFGYFQLLPASRKVLWSAFAWPSDASVPASSTEKELCTLLSAVRSNLSWSDRVVVVVFDSAVAALAINNGSSPSPAVWLLVRDILSLADARNVSFAALWVPREQNTFADYLSHVCTLFRQDHAQGEYSI